MKAISIYTITRNQNTEYLQKLERQLSGRDVFLKIREWELDSMKELVSELERHMQAVYALRSFSPFPNLIYPSLISFSLIILTSYIPENIHPHATQSARPPADTNK